MTRGNVHVPHRVDANFACLFFGNDYSVWFELNLPSFYLLSQQRNMFEGCFCKANTMLAFGRPTSGLEARYGMTKGADCFNRTTAEDGSKPLLSRLSAKSTCKMH